MSTTESEEILARLGRKTFLTPWSYPNPFRDQKQGGKGAGKELCDFLVVFGRHVLIFSDKHIHFPDSGNLSLDWQRWYRRAVADSFKQIRGAQRWLTDYPTRVFADSQCSNSLNLVWPEEPIFHRIVVVRGAAERAQREMGDSSLLVTNEVYGAIGQTFFLYQPETNAFCHIFDENALDIVLDYLDTAPDFIGYLQAKEALFTSKAAVLASSEQDLLGAYLTNLNDQDEHCFPIQASELTSGSKVLIDDGNWKAFRYGPQYQAWQQANEMSYGYDDVIERFYRHQVEGTSLISPSAPNLMQMKEMLRHLATFDRFNRRTIAEKLLGWVDIAKEKVDYRLTTVLVPKSDARPYLGLLVLSKLSHATDYSDYSDYRKKRQTLLVGLAYAIKHVYPDAEDIVCLALELTPDGQSEDAAYLDAREWTAEDAERGRFMHEVGGMLKTAHVDTTQRYEYPVDLVALQTQTLVTTPATRKQGRNERCQCGSGLKFKQCCIKKLR